MKLLPDTNSVLNFSAERFICQLFLADVLLHMQMQFTQGTVMSSFMGVWCEGAEM